MKIKRSERERCKIHTLSSLQQDYDKFIQSGYNIKNAKSSNNVIEQAIFDVPINQVFFIPFLLYQNIAKGCPYQFKSFYQRSWR